jgi:hypothetical protein
MIKKRNLDNSLIQWIMTQTNLGPIFGDIQYVAPASAATSQFRQALISLGTDDSEIQTTLAVAENKTVTRRNDVIIAAPGLYNETDSLTWDKDNVHLLGVGLGLPHADHYLTVGHPLFYVSGDTDVQVVNLTGERNSFSNVIFQNSGANAACVQAVLVNGYGNSFYRCGIQALMSSQQIGAATACSLNIAAGGFYSYFEDCLIGQAEWGKRTVTTSGHLRFSGSSSSSKPSHGQFNRCVFRSSGETAGVPMVYVTNQYATNFYWRYTDCLFYNFYTNWGANLTNVFGIGGAPSYGTQSHILERCTAVGYAEWQTLDSGVEWVVGAMPIVGDGGGLATLMDEATGS